jgi:hypothetical protein
MAKDFLFIVPENQNFQVKDTDFLEFYPNISREMSWKNLRPYIRQAWYNYILPMIGIEFAEVLKESELDDVSLKETVDHIKQALALYTIYLAYPQNNQFISDGTINQAVSDKTQPISQWAFKNARWSQLIGAEKALDVALLDILKKKYNHWDGRKYTHKWITSTDVLLKYVRVNGLRAYLNIRPYFDHALSELGKLLSCDVLDQIYDEKYDPEICKAFHKVQEYIAHKSLELAIPRMLLFVEGNSIIFLSSADGIQDGIGVYSSANMDAVKMLINSCREDAARSLNDMKNIMNKDPETFTEYAQYLESLQTDNALIVTRDHEGDVFGGVMIP